MRTGLVKPKVKESTTTSSDGRLDMVIAFDTTGSMTKYIDAVKKHVKELIPKLFKQNPDLRIGIVAFGDYCDMPSKDIFGKAYQVCELTDNENRLIEFITEAQNTSGGDEDEFYELVIKKIVEETNWREEAKKAAEKGIKFDTLTINKTGWCKELSSTTNGVSAPFSTSSKTSQLVEAAALARGGEKTRGLYKATMDSFEASGDTEMTAVYAAYSKEVIS